MTANEVQIVSVPPGDAPLWVREKWVGLVLPVAGKYGVTQSTSVSVLVKPTIFHHLLAILLGRSQKVAGYRVEAKRAVDILATKSPEAAEWWRQNTPAFLERGRLFVFHAEACRPI